MLPLLAIFGRDLDAGMAVAGIRPGIRAGVRADAAKLGALEIPAAATPRERVALERIVDAAFVAGFRFVAWAASGLALLAALVAMRLDGPGAGGPGGPGGRKHRLAPPGSRA